MALSVPVQSYDEERFLRNLVVLCPGGSSITDDDHNELLISGTHPHRRGSGVTEDLHDYSKTKSTKDDDNKHGFNEEEVHPQRPSLRHQLEIHVRRLRPYLSDEQVVQWVNLAHRSVTKDGREETDKEHSNTTNSADDDPHNNHKKSKTSTTTSGVTTTASSSSATSFSWLDQMMNRQLLANMITWDQIQETAVEAERSNNPHELLSLLQQIKYLDDLLPYWTRLFHLILSKMPPLSRQIPDDYVEVVSQWLDLTRESLTCVTSSASVPAGANDQDVTASFWDVQVDLIRLINGVVTNHCDQRRMNTKNKDAAINPWVQQSDENDTMMLELIKCYYRTWMDWMLRLGRPVVDDERVHHLASVAFKYWMVLPPPPSEKADNGSIWDDAATPLRWLVQVDPYARAWMAWVSLLSSPTEILRTLLLADQQNDEEVEASSQTVPQAQHRPRLSSIARILHAVQDAHNSSSICSSIHRDYVNYWLCVLYALLLHLRVAHFPWDQLDHTIAPSNNDDSTISTTVKGRGMVALGTVYIQALHRLQSSPKSNPTMEAICWDAVEILLWGCQSDDHNAHDNPSVKDSIRSKLIKDIQNLPQSPPSQLCSSLLCGKPVATNKARAPNLS